MDGPGQQSNHKMINVHCEPGMRPNCMPSSLWVSGDGLAIHQNCRRRLWAGFGTSHHEVSTGDCPMRTVRVKGKRSQAILLARRSRIAMRESCREVAQPAGRYVPGSCRPMLQLTQRPQASSASFADGPLTGSNTIRGRPTLLAFFQWQRVAIAHSTTLPAPPTNVAGGTMRMIPRKGCSTSRSASPVTITSVSASDRGCAF